LAFIPKLAAPSALSCAEGVGAAEATCGEGFTQRGGAISGGKGDFPRSLAPLGGNWVGRRSAFRARDLAAH